VLWEDRYHATAADQGDYLVRCIAYINLNIVRAGVVDQLEDWRWSDYREIQFPSHRYTIIDVNELLILFGAKNLEQYKETHSTWISESLQNGRTQKYLIWLNSLAVGSDDYIERVKLILQYVMSLSAGDNR
jgi:putative transposase